MDLWPPYESQWLDTLRWRPNQPQQAAFQRLYEALLAANQQVNLTRITTPEDFWEKHLWDSLQGVSPWLSPEDGENLTAAENLAPSSALQVMDIGTGGGFPGLPVAIVFPHWQVTLMDATRKKMAAIETMVQTLGLENVRLLPERAEQAGHHPQYRETYDLALLRAVGPTNTCAEYALPLLKLGGRAVLYRGQWTEAEEASLAAILPRLGGKLLGIRAITTPLAQGIRHNIDLIKVKPTPDAFPRLPGVPAKTPLS